MTDKKRHLTEKIEALLELFPVVAIIGPRQCGKSTLAAMLRPKWKYYDLERPDDFQLVASDPLGFFSLRPQGVIIDEIQQYPELFKVLRGVIDSDRGNVGRYLVTGSSSPEIVRGLSESLAGRIATVELWPFKISEFHSQPLPRIYSLLTDKNVKIDELLNLTTEITVNQVFDQWMNGGYPEPRIKSAHVQAFHGLWMDEYFSDYIRRDIQRLFPRINSQVFRLFIHTLSFQSGNIINHSDTARFLEVSSVTTKLYFEILHNTFVWRNLRSYQGNRLKTIQKS